MGITNGCIRFGMVAVRRAVGAHVLDRQVERSGTVSEKSALEVMTECTVRYLIAASLLLREWEKSGLPTNASIERAKRLIHHEEDARGKTLHDSERHRCEVGMGPLES